jgi:hypothetical protein
VALGVAEYRRKPRRGAINPDTDRSLAKALEDAMAIARPLRRSAGRRKFYWLHRRVRSRASGFRLLHGDTLFPGYGRPDATSAERSAFLKPEVPLQDFPEAPVFLSDSKLGLIHWDFEVLAGYWFISDKMKTVLQTVDPEAFALLQCDVRSSDGRERPVRWLCDVVRVLDALDEEKSEASAKWYGKKLVCMAKNGNKYYSPVGREALFFKESVVGRCHIFRMKYSHRTVICDEEMRLACKSALLTGLSFSVTATAHDAKVISRHTGE